MRGRIKDNFRFSPERTIIDKKGHCHFCDRDMKMVEMIEPGRTPDEYVSDGFIYLCKVCPDHHAIVVCKDCITNYGEMNQGKSITGDCPVNSPARFNMKLAKV